MNKRGLTLELVVKAAILVIVLFVMGNFIRTTFLAGEEARHVILPDYGEFEPYEYEPVGDDATVSDSVNALICAINAVAKIDNIDDKYFLQYEGYETFFEEKDWRKGTCEGGVVVEEIEKEEEPTGTLCRANYGNCVASLSNEKAHFEEADYDENNNENVEELCPEEKPFCEIQCPFEWGSGCNDVGEKKCRLATARYCMSSGYWCQTNCKEELYRGACSEDNGDIFCGYSNYVEFEIEEEIQKQVEQEETTLSCTDGILYGSNCVQCFAEGATNFKCTVSDFYLPQTGAGDRGTLDRWIAGLGDPEYIVYYEKFPQGEDIYWTADFASFGPAVLVLSGISAFVFPLSDEIKAATKVDDFGDALKIAKTQVPFYRVVTGGSSLVSSIGNVRKWFSKDTYEGLVKKKGLRHILITNQDYLLDPKTADEKMEVISKYISGGTYKAGASSTDMIDELAPLFTKDLDSIYYTGSDEAVAELTKMIDEIKPKHASFLRYPEDVRNALYREALARELTQEFVDEDVGRILSISSGEVIEEMAQRQATRQGMKAIVGNMFDSSGDFSDRAFKNFLKEHGKSAEGLEWIIDNQQLSGTQTKKLLTHLNDVTGDIPLDRQVLFNRKIMSGQIDEITQSIDAGGNIIESTASTMSSIYGGAKNVPVFGKIVGLPEFAAKLGLAPVSTPSRRFFTWAALSYYGTLHDSVNQKFYPSGKDSLVLTTPSLIGVKHEFNLQNAENYAIALREDGDTPIRFHMASPCKADLELYPATVIAKSDETSITRYDLYDFGYGFTPVEKGSIQYDEVAFEFSQKEYPQGDSLIRDADEAMEEENYKEALIKYLEYLEKYPDSKKFDSVFNKVDSILTTGEILTTFDKEELREIAFTDRLDVDTRARINSYAIRMKDSVDEGCGSYEGYKEKIEWCEGLINGEYYAFRDSVFIQDSGAVYDPLYDWTYFDYSYYGYLKKQRFEDISTKYMLSLLYVDSRTHFDVRTGESAWLIDADYDNLDFDIGLLELYKWIGERFNFGYADRVVFGEAGQDPWISPFMFDIGDFPVPKHLLYKQDVYLDKKISWLPDPDTYEDEVVRYNRQLLRDSSFTGESYGDLLKKKVLYETKASILENVPGQSITEQEVENWVSISKEIQNSYDEKITKENAVKLIGFDETVYPEESFFESDWHKFRSITIEADIDESLDSNYCYHGHHPTRATIRTLVVGASLFADEIGGTLAGGACASTAVLAPFSGLCARGGMFVTDIIFALGENFINKLDKWPRR